ncbi:chemotaxis protein CheD [Petroclostridium sp. X23]|uniref:chemotaxis protein CheD n=1 Tax=Petroclostridium sp. X23 TaxID=3045146 RepID=UPI0024ADB58C|nr:chemotaxis protein CheD [Petroclostridium sp. X23]WHH58960.1 chemotaxis protein CheD [Petroclostridium sp. X23]
MDNLIKVGMADLNTTKCPGVLTTLGLGSCVGIALYDRVTKVGGLAHIMLPNSTQVKNNSNRAKFADTAIYDLLDMMINLGAKKNNITAKLAGGAQMFSFSQANDIMKIGQRNAAASKEILNKLTIPIIAEDTGGNYGRTIELDTVTGLLMVKTIGYGIKQL